MKRRTRLGLNRLLFALFSCSSRTISELSGLGVINFTEAVLYNHFKKSLKRVLELLEYKIGLKLSRASESLQKCLPKFT